MTLAPSGFLTIDGSDLEYRMFGPAPDQAPAIVMLHEGLGSAALWGDFPDRLQAATSAGVFVYSRAGYGASSPVKLPRPLDYMHIEALEVLPKLLGQMGFRRGLLVGHSDGASIAAIYAGGVQDHRVQGIALIAPRLPRPKRPMRHPASNRSWRAGTGMSTTPSTAGMVHGSTRNSAAGIFPNTSPTSVFPWPSCRAWMMSMERCAKSRLHAKSAIVRSM